MARVDEIKAVLRAEDIEGYIKIHGAPDDEYDSEAEEISGRLQPDSYSAEEHILSVLMRVWSRAFNLDENDLAKRMPRLKRVARLLSR